jgi:hypothetical protein
MEEKMEQTERRFAVLIDADNVSPKYIKYILDEVSDLGIATYKRIYGDWTDNAKKSWKDALLEWSVNPIQQYTYTFGKNATDAAMIIDAMDILYTSNVNGFCLVSSDSDFTKLAQRLREAGMFVLGMGERKTPKPFSKACDTFKILEVIAQEDEEIDTIKEEPHTVPPHSNHHGFFIEVNPNSRKEMEEKTEITSLDEIKKAITRTVTENNNKGRQTGMGEVGSVLSKKFSDFDVRNYGYSKLSTFLENLNEFDVIKSGKNYMVKDKKAAVSSNEIEACIMELVISNHGQVDNMSLIYEHLKRHYPGFDLKKYGFSRVSSFIRSFHQFKIEGNVVRMK